MKSNSVFNCFLIFRRVSIFLLCSILICSSCNNSTSNVPSQTTAIKSWVSLNIKFKLNSSREARQRSMNTVMRILADTIDAMRKDGYFKDLPEIISIQDPYNDSTSVKIKVDFRSRSSHDAKSRDAKSLDAKSLDADTICPSCICTCVNGCKICNTIVFKNNISPEDAIESVEDSN